MPDSTNRELKTLMQRNNLSAADVAEKCGVTRRTAMRWLQKKDSLTYVVMPMMALRLLRLTAVPNAEA